MNTSATNSPFQTANSVQDTVVISLECFLIIVIFWLIFKKSNNQKLNLTNSEQERILKEYMPENLVEDVSANHYVLNPLVVQGKIGIFIYINGTECIDFGTHDYLGMIGNKNIEERAIQCVETYGVGSCGPRGFYGTTVEHMELETLLADILQTESALVYSFGFATIASAIPAYAKKTDVIFVDECRNFAIQKGLDASKSKVIYFKHNDTKDLERVLKIQDEFDLLDKIKASKVKRYLIIEGIYVNTGKICPLPEMLELCKKYKVRVFLDESASFGTLGLTGRGVTEYFGVSSAEVDLIMGSFEYSLASVGGFCAGSRFLVDHQHASAQGFCFSASLPSLHAAAVIGALQTIQDNPNTVATLNKVCHFMHFALNSSVTVSKYFTISGEFDSPIHILTLNNEMLHSLVDSDAIINSIIAFGISKRVVLSRVARLKEDSSVHQGSMRITTNIFHTEDQISYLVGVLEKACNYTFPGHYS